MIEPKLTWKGCSPTSPSGTMCSTGSRFVGVPQKMHQGMEFNLIGPHEGLAGFTSYVLRCLRSAIWGFLAVLSPLFRVRPNLHRRFYRILYRTPHRTFTCAFVAGGGQHKPHPGCSTSSWRGGHGGDFTVDCIPLATRFI